MIEKLIQRIQKMQHGFLGIQKAADEVFSGHTAKESLLLVKKLFVSKIYQARSLATFILGRLARNFSAIWLAKSLESDDPI